MEDGSEEDIWDYKTSKKKRRLTGPPATKKGRPRTGKSKKPSKNNAAEPVEPPNGKSKTITPQKTPGSGKKSKSVTPKRERPHYEGYCPFCQMPLSLLLIETPQVHVSECLEWQFQGIEECPSGLRCENTIESHYQRYQHRLLAEFRAKGGNLHHESSTVRSETADSPGAKADTMIEEEVGGRSKSCPKTRTLSSSQGKLIPIQTSQSERMSQSENKKARVSCASRRSKSSQDIDSELQGTNLKQRRRRLNYKTTENETLPRDSKTPLKNASDCQDVSPNSRLKETLTISDCLLFDDSDRDISDMLADALSGDDEKESVISDCGNGQEKSDTDIFDEEEKNGGSVEISKSLLTPETNICTDSKSSCSSDKNGSVKLCSDSGFFFEQQVCESELAVNDMESEIVENEQRVISNPSVARAGSVVQEEKRIPDGNIPEIIISDVDEIIGNNKKNPGKSVNGLNKRKSIVKQDGAKVIAAPKQSSLFSFFKSAPSTKGPPKNSTPKTKNNDLNDPNNNMKKKQKSAETVKLKPPVKKEAKTNKKMVEVQNDSTGASSKNTLTLAVPDSSTTDSSMKSVSESDRSYSSTGYGNRRPNRPCPFYKKIPGTPFTVDAFCYGTVPGCTAYFLSHFHYDHYRGLGKKFQHPIYCSKITANLVRSKLYVLPEFIHTIPLETPTVLAGVEVTFLEANHCPGSVLILFKLQDGTNVLHTGDFRAHSLMEKYPPLVTNKIHTLYLDTTYCDPQYTFPEQGEVIELAVSLACNAVRTNPGTLIVCGSYTIGKERVFTAVAEVLGSKIAVTRDKKKVLDCLEDQYLRDTVTLDWSAARVHVLPMNSLNLKKLQDHLALYPQFTGILALEPTGWSHSNRRPSLEHIRPKASRYGITVYGIPYSEHSSFSELQRFVKFIKADKILPTVNNGNPQSRKKMEAIFVKWMTELSSPDKQKVTAKQKTLTTFLRPSQQ